MINSTWGRGGGEASQRRRHLAQALKHEQEFASWRRNEHSNRERR